MPTPPRPRILMLGTGDFALPTFLHLVATGHDVAALVTQPDRPQGRNQELIPSRIKLAAVERGIVVAQPEDVNGDEAVAAVRDFGPDLLVTAAYGQILSPKLLKAPRFGGINLHGSILPAYRGAAPVARGIENGETEFGVTVIQMSPRIDAGGMIAVARTPVDPDETAGELEARLAEIGAPLVALAVGEVVAGTAVVLPQDRSRVTKAPKLRKDDGRIDWSRPALAVHNLVRAMQPWPVAQTQVLHDAGPPTRLIVHRTRVVADPPPADASPGTIIPIADRLIIRAGEGLVELLAVQSVGRKPVAAAEYLRGRPFRPGDRLGEPGIKSPTFS